MDLNHRQLCTRNPAEVLVQSHNLKQYHPHQVSTDRIVDPHTHRFHHSNIDKLRNWFLDRYTHKHRGQHQSLVNVWREFVKEFHLTKHPQLVSSLKAFRSCLNQAKCCWGMRKINQNPNNPSVNARNTSWRSSCFSWRWSFARAFQKYVLLMPAYYPDI